MIDFRRFCLHLIRAGNSNKHETRYNEKNIKVVFLDSPREALVSSRLWSVFNNVAGGGQNWLCGLPQNRLFLRFFEISKIGPNGSELNSKHNTLAAFSKKLNLFRDI